MQFAILSKPLIQNILKYCKFFQFEFLRFNFTCHLNEIKQQCIKTIFYQDYNECSIAW